MNCEATNTAGEPCGAPSRLVDPETRRCPAHAPGGADRMRQISAQGGQATAEKLARPELEEQEIPEPPETLEDVAAWASWAMRKVASGELSEKQAHQVGYLGRLLLQAYERLDVEGELEELKEKIRLLKEGKLQDIEEVA